jgi:hypothetical protein
MTELAELMEERDPLRLTLQDPEDRRKIIQKFRDDRAKIMQGEKAPRGKSRQTINLDDLEI